MSCRVRREGLRGSPSFLSPPLASVPDVWDPGHRLEWEWEGKKNIILLINYANLHRYNVHELSWLCDVLGQ